MDELADFIAKIRSNQSKIVISRDTLKEIIDVLDDQGSKNIDIEAFLQYVFDKEIGNPHQQQSPFKTPPESPFPENLESPQFNFRTPLKPFTPFPMKDEGVEKNSNPSMASLPQHGPFTLSPEEKQQHHMENGPSSKIEAEKPDISSSEQSNSQSSTGGSLFWGKDSPRFAQTFAEKLASSTNPTSHPDDGAFNFTTWKEFKFELGAASGAKRVASRGANKSKNPPSPIQPSTSGTSFTIPISARTDSTNINPHDGQEVPITSRSSDGTFKVHSVRPEDSLHTLNEDAANSSDTPSTNSGKSQSTTSTFTKYVFEDLPEAVRSGKVNTTTVEDDNSSDEDSEMSVDDMRSPFFASSGGKTPSVPDTNVQKENQPSNNISNSTTTNNSKNTVNDGSEFPSVEKPFKTSSDKLDDTQGTTTQPSMTETSEEFQFNTDNISSKLFNLNLGAQSTAAGTSSAGYSFSLGKAGQGTASQKPHIKKLVSKKKDHGKTQHATVPPSTDNSAKPGVMSGLFQSSPFVSGQFTDANPISSQKQEEQNQGFNVGSNGDNAKNQEPGQPTGDAPPAWWSAYQQQPPRPTSAKENEGASSSTSADDSAQPTSEPEPKSEPKPASNVPLGPTGDAFDKTLLDILDVYSKQGKQWYSMGQYDKALEAYSNCLNIAPKDWIGRATITGNRAAVNFMMNRYMESVDDCDDALRLDPTLVKLHIRKGKSLIRLGHFNPADAAFWKVLQLNMTDFHDIVSDEDYLMQLEQTLTSAKLEAQAGMREVVKLKENMNKLISAEAKKEYAEGLKVAEDILHRAPFARNAIEAKARALCELQRFETAKDYIEEVTVSYPANLRAVHAHVSAPTTCPNKAELQWTEVKQPPSVVFSLTAVKQLAFCMGSSMATIYIQVLKNHVFSKNCSADVMQKMFSLLEMLSNDLPAQDLLETWSWVPRETAKLRELLSLKQTADQQFKDKSYRAAMQSYSQALRMDASAKRWNAILHCNRAACHMCLNMYAEAVNDCNTAIQLYADYHRAYLRRARAHRAMNKYQESVRDYRRYLCSDPVPVDFSEVQKELDNMIEEKAQETQRQQRQEQEWKKQQQQQQQQRPSSAKGNSSHSGSQKGANFQRPRSAHRHNSNTWAYGASGRQFFEDDDDDDWNDDGDEDDDFNFNTFKPQQQQQYQRFHQQQQQQSRTNKSSSSSSRPSTGSGPSSSTSSSSSTFNRSNSNNNYSSARPGSAAGTGGTSPRPNNTSSNASHTTANASGQTTLFSLKEKDHYTILGVDTAASDRDIKMAYRKLALQFHPDKNKDAGAEERFKMISMAYSVLIDKTSRREYDLSRPLPRSSRQW